MGHDFLHTSNFKNKVMKKEAIATKLNVKSKFIMFLVMTALPMVRKFATRQLTKLASYATVALTTAFASYGIENEDTKMQVLSVVSGLIGFGLMSLDLFVAWLTFKLNPPPKAILVELPKETERK